MYEPINGSMSFKIRSRGEKKRIALSIVIGDKKNSVIESITLYLSAILAIN
jgi:hypothetical protein